MEKAKSLLMFAAKVFVAVAITNLILNLIPGGAGNWLRALQANPIGTLKSGNPLA